MLTCSTRRTVRLVIGALGLVFSLGAMMAASAGAETPAPKVTAPQVASPSRVLFVGNSYLYYGDSLHNHVRRMAIAAKLHDAKDLKYKSVTISGGALFDHDITSYLKPGKLRVKDGFQVVVLQGGSAAPLSDKRRAQFLETVKAFDGEIKKAGGRTALYMTHAYIKPHKQAAAGQINDIAKMYVETGNAIGALVLPVGLAFEEAYKRKPDMQLQKSFDGSHPDLIGTYLAACVVYAGLYGKPALGNTYDYYGKIDKATARFLQEVADDTIKSFYGRK
ncbi:MAG: hypothetical protein R3D67_03240 [Hyphomicrobiaceae bacterium]